MKINIRGQKLEITEGIRDHVEGKLSKLEKYFDKPDEVEINVLAKIKGIEQIIEVTIPGRFMLRAEESHADLYAAVDLVIDKLETQIKKNKSRLRDKHRSEVAQFNFESFEEKEEKEEKAIVKRKEIELKPMSEEEAILQMELLNHDFFLFRNINGDCFSVIYKRKDGNYGIIDTN